MWAKFMADFGGIVSEQSALTGPNLEAVDPNLMEDSALKIEEFLSAMHGIGNEFLHIPFNEKWMEEMHWHDTARLSTCIDSRWHMITV